MSTNTTRQKPRHFMRGDPVWVTLGPLEFPGFVKGRQCLGYDVFIEYAGRNHVRRTLDIDDVPSAELRAREIAPHNLERGRQ